VAGLLRSAVDRAVSGDFEAGLAIQETPGFHPCNREGMKMCGDLDEDTAIHTEIQERFLATAKRMGVATDASAENPGNLSEATGRIAYMDRIFRQGLERAVADVQGASEDEKIDAIASLAIAFARLAGFIAGNLPPDADLYKSVIEAATAGHGEPAGIAAEILAQRSGHHHHHDH
jgi:hypothetical protein